MPATFGYCNEQEGRLTFDVERAKILLREAGYAGGVEVTMDCPNNRYVNDERICTAIAAMRARVGIRRRVVGLPRAQFFQKLAHRDSSFSQKLGWRAQRRDDFSHTDRAQH